MGSPINVLSIVLAVVLFLGARVPADARDQTPVFDATTTQQLYGDIWERPGPSKRGQSLTTISTLVTMNRSDQLRSRLAITKRNGSTILRTSIPIGSASRLGLVPNPAKG
jgi:hypothetical protein